MSYCKFNILEELAKVVRGEETKADKDALLHTAAEMVLASEKSKTGL
jgi:hypothetical protein